MALSREQKDAAVTEISDLLASSKMTVVARYQGTPVKAMQQLRAQAKTNGTEIKVVKNRLFKLAVSSVDNLAAVSLDQLNGQLLYAFNPADEAAAAQSLAAFARTSSQLEFVGAISADGQVLSALDVRALADLPTKDQLRVHLAATIASPISGVAAVLAANVRGVLNVLHARAESI